jgi:hypothetical protein
VHALAFKDWRPLSSFAMSQHGTATTLITGYGDSSQMVLALLSACFVQRFAGKFAGLSEAQEVF